MRRKEDAEQSVRVRIAVTVMVFLLGLMAYVLPGRADFFTGFLGLPFFFVLFGGVFCGALPGFLLGALIPLTASLFLKQLDFAPNALAELVAYSLSGLTAGIFYGRFRTGFGAAMGGVLLRLPVSALVLGLYHFLTSASYSLMDFVREGIVDVHPALVLPLAVIPFLTFLFRKNGVMEVLRGEPRE